MLYFADNVTDGSVEFKYNSANISSLTWKYDNNTQKSFDLLDGHNWHTPWNWDGKVV